MATKQGSLDLLNEPIAQTLLHSALPAHLAYNWHDGTPRVIPIGFYWNGKEIVVCSPLDAPKVQILKDGVKVAITIDSLSPATQVLLVRGTVRTETVEGLPAEYIKSVEKGGKEQAQSWLDYAGKLWPRMARIFIQPEWVGLIDFEARMPSAVEKGKARLEEINQLTMAAAETATAE